MLPDTEAHWRNLTYKQSMNIKSLWIYSFNQQSNLECQTLEKVSKKSLSLEGKGISTNTDPNFFLNINVGITNSDVSQTHVTALGSKKSNGKVIFAKDGDKNRSTAIEVDELSRSIKSRRNHLEYLRNRTRDQLRSAPKRKSDIKLSDYDVSFAR